MTQEVPYYDDEIDLREVIRTLLHGWKVILFMAAFAGAAAFGYSRMQTPVYEAKATLLIDQNSILLNTNPVNLLNSDEIRQEVANTLEVPETSLPVPNIVNDKTDQTLFTITIQASSAQQAAHFANAWADVGIGRVKAEAEAKLAEAEAKLAEAEAELAEADRALVTYLERHALDQWSWADLSALTGVGWVSSGAAQRDTQTLPSISAEQRLEITQLMRARMYAEQLYATSLNQAEKAQDTAETSPALNQNEIAAVVNAATIPTNPTSPKTLVNTALGIAAGLMLGVFWVFAAAWWREEGGQDTK